MANHRALNGNLTKASALITVGILAFAVAGPWAGAAGMTDAERDALHNERRGNLLALYTKLLCSGVFVSGRSPTDFIEHDL